MKRLPRIIHRIYRNIIDSIAFYPSLMVISTIAFAIFMLYFEYTSVSADIKDVVEVALVNNPENARLILGTIVGGIISLTVFSFSMVMVVLNRASTNLSPRVIPGIISRKSHQFVLGFYLSTIIYSLLLIININTSDDGMEVPALGIFFAMIFAIASLSLFVFFIDSISKSIQVDNILNGIYKNTNTQMARLFQRDEIRYNDEDQWYSIASHKSGFFNSIDQNNLVKLLDSRDIILKVNTTKGFFISKGYPFLSLNKEISNDDAKEIINYIELGSEEHFKEHFNFGFKQITEIAVKALSPGINDPGTANKAIELLTILFCERMKLQDFSVKKYNNTTRIIFSEWTFEEMLYQHFAPIREYGKRDTLVMINLLNAMKNLWYADKEKKYTKEIKEHVQSIIDDFQENNNNFLDQQAFNLVIEKVNKISTYQFGILN